MKVRWKLIVTILVPLLVLAFVVGSEVQQRRTVAQETGEARQLIELMGLADEVRGNVQLPVTLVVLPQAPDINRRVRAAHADAARSITALDAALASLEPESHGPALVDAVTSVEDSLQSYKAASLAARGEHEVSDVVTTALKDLVFAAAKTIRHDGELARGALGYASLVAASEGREHAVHHVAHVGAGPAPEDRIRGIVAENRQEDLAFEVFRTTASTEQREQLAQLNAGPESKRVAAAMASAEDTVAGKRFAFDFDATVPAMERTIELLESYADDVRTDLELQAASKQDAAASYALYFLAAAVAASLVALALAILVVVSLSRRLRRLVAGARTLADHQLPAMVESLRNPGASESLIGDPVVLEDLGRDEIGELGEAFNSVQRTFVEVARDQAELLKKGISEIFVKLARRNQSLVERQIELLDSLEASEKDPDILANLFRLDHLATRVRRNAESLLVLAGAEPTRKWTDPVPLEELLQGAMAEIEDYERIRIAGSGAVTALVVGSAALDVAHLVAELLDNAVRFSPPETGVDVVTRRRGDLYTLYVSDSGVGMTDEQLEEANELLANPPEPGLDLSRTLGLYVVARLAERHGVKVRLASSAFDGVVASVVLPPELVIEAPALDDALESARPVPPVPHDEPAVMSFRPAAVELPIRDAAKLEELAHPVPMESTPLTSAAPQPVSPPEPLPQRSPGDPEDMAESGEHHRALGVAPSTRTPDERREQLSRFLDGVDEGRRLGRAEADSDSPHEQVS